MICMYSEVDLKLSNCTQSVLICATKSIWSQVTSDISQISVLRPILSKGLLMTCINNGAEDTLRQIADAPK